MSCASVFLRPISRYILKFRSWKHPDYTQAINNISSKHISLNMRITSNFCLHGPCMHGDVLVAIEASSIASLIDL
jgi:hypothetical protein